MKVRASIIQMVSTAAVKDNLDMAEALLHDAAKDNSQLAVLPENFAYMGMTERDKLEIMEIEGGGPIQAWLSKQAKETGMWVIGGSVPLVSTNSSCYSSSLVFNPDGKMCARYDKIHLFDVNLEGNESYRESSSITPGKNPVSVQLPWGLAGLSICYDVRFPELYRNYAGAYFLSVPSAFTKQTGEAHWELLLRTRAVENQAFVLAAGQGGLHQNGRVTYGNSMIVDPWGNVLGRAGTGPSVVTIDLDIGALLQIRRNIPCLSNRAL